MTRVTKASEHVGPDGPRTLEDASAILRIAHGNASRAKTVSDSKKNKKNSNRGSLTLDMLATQIQRLVKKAVDHGVPTVEIREIFEKAFESAGRCDRPIASDAIGFD